MARRLDNTPAVRQQLTEVLIRANFDFDAAARELGISRRAFVNRLEKLGRRPRAE